MKSLLSTLLFLMSFNLLSQSSESSTITGTLNDTEGAPLPMANVILFSAEDSSMVKGEITADDGSFVLRNIPTSS